MILQMKSAEFRYADNVIFSGANLDINEGDSIGLVGANGAGKSTLLGCICGELSLFEGDIIKKNGLTIGYLKQNCNFDSSKTLYAEMMSVFDYQLQLIEQINNIANKMATCPFESDEYKKLSSKYHNLTLEADAKEAYSVEVKVKTVLNGMGMMQFADRIVSTLSGGEKTKAALCKLLLERPELMILDEPTNHLDYKTLDWLENFLSTCKSALLVVSHDRYFLDKICTTIWDVQHKEVIAYKGNYTKYRVLKAERIENQTRAYEKQQKEIEKLTDYIARNKVRASTADMAKSREKMLDRMEIISAPKADERPPRFNFNYSNEPSEFPLIIQNFTFGYDEKVLLSNVNMQIRRGQKVALLGLNGTGKSTLIRRIASQNPYDLGKIVFGKNVRFGFYDQENVNLDGNLRVLDQLWFDNTRMSQTDVRSLLAQVTLGADDVYKLVKELSGGERAKLGLAMLMAKDNNLLILDEPTNHLDLPSREALEDALKKYTGTLLVVSHDRYFVNSIASTIVELDNKQLNVYAGNYDNFIASKQQAVVEVPKSAKSSSTYRSPKQRAEQANRAKRLKELENLITKLETDIENLQNQMALPDIASDFSKLSVVMQQLHEANDKLENALVEWETLSQE